MNINKLLKNKSKDIKTIISTTLNISYSDLILKKDNNISFFDYIKCKKNIKKYNKGVPLQYILKKSYFYNNEFYVNKNVLIPRPETEILIEKLYNAIKDKKNINILDIGTGSGIIAITLKKLIPTSSVDAIDISKKALKVAKYNAKKNNTNINFIHSDLYQNINKKYDVIVSNPPYISYDGIVDYNVKKYEPSIALFAKNNGLEYYKRIIKDIDKYLKKDGILAFEIGYDQKDVIIKELNKDNKYKINTYKDYNNFDRVMIIKMNK